MTHLVNPVRLQSVDKISTSEHNTANIYRTLLYHDKGGTMSDTLLIEVPQLLVGGVQSVPQEWTESIGPCEVVTLMCEHPHEVEFLWHRVKGIHPTRAYINMDQTPEHASISVFLEIGNPAGFEFNQDEYTIIEHITGAQVPRYAPLTTVIFGQREMVDVEQVRYYLSSFMRNHRLMISIGFRIPHTQTACATYAVIYEGKISACPHHHFWVGIADLLTVPDPPPAASHTPPQHRRP